MSKHHRSRGASPWHLGLSLANIRQPDQRLSRRSQDRTRGPFACHSGPCVSLCAFFFFFFFWALWFCGRCLMPHVNTKRSNPSCYRRNLNQDRRLVLELQLIKIFSLFSAFKLFHSRVPEHAPRRIPFSSPLSVSHPVLSVSHPVSPDLFNSTTMFNKPHLISLLGCTQT